MPVKLRLARVSLFVILIITAIPAGLRDPRTDYWVYWHPIFELDDAVGNILLFFPLGLFLQPAASLSRVTGLGAGLSAIIEVAQLFFLRRNSQPSDFICNTLGVLCGGVVGKLLGVRSDRIPFGNRSGVNAIVAATCWSAVYLSIGTYLRPAAGRGSIAIVAFLCALGLVGIFRPMKSFSRLMCSGIGGAMGTVALMKASPISLFSTLALAAAFGLAGVYCTTSDDDRLSRPHPLPAPGDAAGLHSA
jgi:hypothetical protein